MKEWYCPVCGSDRVSNSAKCDQCGTEIPAMETEHEIEYYAEQAQKYGGSIAGKIYEEAKKNPRFSQEAHDKYLRKISAETDEWLHARKAKQEAEAAQFTPRCPTCQSTNVKKISVGKRAVFGAAFGLFSKTARSQFECMNCGYKW